MTARPEPTPAVLADPAGGLWGLTVDTAGELGTELLAPPPVPDPLPFPDSDSTGTRSVNGPALRPMDGDLRITTPGTYVSDADIWGRVILEAADITLERCRVRGNGGPASNTGLVVATHANCLRARLKALTLVPDTASIWLTGVIGHDYDASGCNVYGTVDGFGVYNPTAGRGASRLNVKITRNYVHDLAYRGPDKNHKDDHTHNDGVQIQGGYTDTDLGPDDPDVLIEANTILCGRGEKYSNLPQPYPDTAALTGQAIGMTPNVSSIGNVAIRRNLLDGGAQSITGIVNGAKTVKYLDIAGNVFGGNNPLLNKNGIARRRPVLLDARILPLGWASGWTVDTAGNVFNDGRPITVDSWVGAG